MMLAILSVHHLTDFDKPPTLCVGCAPTSCYSHPVDGLESRFKAGPALHVLRRNCSRKRGAAP